MKEIKLCKDCRHYRYFTDPPACLKPSVVDDEWRPEIYCEKERYSDDGYRCGIEGKYWEERGNENQMV
jgi:hypothetical protein